MSRRLSTPGLPLKMRRVSSQADDGGEAGAGDGGNAGEGDGDDSDMSADSDEGAEGGAGAGDGGDGTAEEVVIDGGGDSGGGGGGSGEGGVSGSGEGAGAAIYPLPAAVSQWVEGGCLILCHSLSEASLRILIATKRCRGSCGIRLPPGASRCYW
jgi:hypothetical protein